MVKQKKASILEILKKSNSILPHVVLASTILALVYPPSFTWFTSRSLADSFYEFVVNTMQIVVLFLVTNRLANCEFPCSV